MKKIAEKLMLFTFAMLLSVFMMTPVTAEAKVKAPKEITMYLQSNYIENEGSIYISGLSKNSKVKNVKSGKKSVVEVKSVRNDDVEYTKEYMNASKKKKTSKYTDATIWFDCLREGKTNISYKIGKDKYKTQINVLKYENPAKTVKISGIKSGKSSNLAGMLKNDSVKWLTLDKDVENPNIFVEANTKKNWKVTGISFYDDTYEGATRGNDYNYSIEYPKGMKKMSLNIEQLKKKNYSVVEISFYNTKTKGTLSCQYRINAENYD